MTKWIRWSGLIGFSVLAALIVVFWMFAAAPLIKLSIEKFGSEALGAKIDVKDVSLNFNPLVLAIEGVEITDKDAPMTNAVSFERAEADMSLFPLLLGKSIIQDMSLEGVEFGTARQVSGALAVEETAEKQATSNEPSGKAAETPEEAAKTQLAETKGGSAQSLPSADEILEREPLDTVTRGEKFKSSLETHKKELDDSIAAVPNKSAIKQYQKDLDSLLSGKLKSVDDFKARKKALDKLKKQFKEDQKAIKRAQLAIKGAKKDLGSQWPLLKKAPKDDFNNIKGKYTLDAAGTSNLAALLLGEDAGGYAKTGLDYYEKFSPLLEGDEEAELIKEQQAKRLEGEFIHFPTDRPLPDFWLKNLSFSATLPVGEVAVVVKDITHQQDVINKATTLSANGKDLKSIKALSLNGVLDHRNGQGTDTFDLDIQQWRLKGLNLGLAGLELDHSDLNLQGDVVFTGANMKAEGKGQFSQATFQSSDSTVLAKEMLSALGNIDQFNVNAKAKGALSSPDISLSSDLDSKLSRAFNKRIKQRQKQLEKKLREKLAEKLLSYSGDYQDQLKDMDLANGDLGDASKAMGKMAKAKINSYQDQVKADAKAKSDKKKKALEDKVKDKFKKLF
jgi:uncharacterized protein (TIGR03545 family)